MAAKNDDKVSAKNKMAYGRGQPPHQTRPHHYYTKTIHTFPTTLIPPQSFHDYLTTPPSPILIFSQVPGTLLFKLFNLDLNNVRICLTPKNTQKVIPSLNFKFSVIILNSITRTQHFKKAIMDRLH